MVKSKMTTLDIGSGSLGCHTSRGDVAVDICRNPAHKPENFVPADAHKLPFMDEQFENINFLEIIEHVENPAMCLREIWRVLKPDGTVTISTPNPTHWRRILRHLLHVKIKPWIDHIGLWDMAELENLLRTTGFKVVKEDYVCVWERDKYERWTHKYIDQVVHALSLCHALTGRSVQITAIKEK
jgi:ubiquinone/menaquinone biosynthesis C-methylase UbiE